MNQVYENIKALTSVLVGGTVEVTISEPWEFGTEVSSDHISAVVERVNIIIDSKTEEFTKIEKLLVRILKPFAFKTLKFEYLLASPRHFGSGLRELSLGGETSFNFLRISALDAKSTSPFQANSSWRGGPEALIGTLKL